MVQFFRNIEEQSLAAWALALSTLALYAFMAFLMVVA